MFTDVATKEEEDKEVFALHVLLWCIVGALIVCLVVGITQTSTTVTESTIVKQTKK